MRTATFLFAAGQETTARLLAAALKHLAEHPELQDELRARPRAHPELPRGGAAHREPGEGRLPARAPRHDGRRRRHRGGHAGDVVERRGQPRPPALRMPGTSSGSTAPTRRRTSRSGAATTRARRHRWRVPKAGSASSASSTGCTTSASPRSTTARRATRRFGYAPTWVLRGLTELHLEFTPVGGREPMSRVAVVTGARRASGSASAQQLVADGHRVALLDRNGDGREGRGRRDCAGRGRRSRSTWPTAQSVDAAFARVRAELGPIEMLVTSAGIESFDALARHHRRQVGPDPRGQPHRHVQLRPGRDPRHARRGLGPHRHHLVVERAVGRTEHGALRRVEGRRHRAHQGAGGRVRPQGITANTIRRASSTRRWRAPPKPPATSPASTSSAPMVPLGRAGTPADIAAACSFLCSDGGSYITGQVIGVNGGMYI